MLEDKPTLQLAKLKSHRKHHGEHSSDDLVGGNDSQASKDKDTLLQIASSSSSSQACRSGALPLLEDTRVGHIFSDMAHISVIKPACLCAFTFSVKIARYKSCYMTCCKTYKGWLCVDDEPKARHSLFQ